jgi:rod shape-determining protein MreD
MSYYIAIPLLLLIGLAEVSVLPYFQVEGLQPNLMLVFVLSWMMVRGQREALFLIPLGGIILGLVDGAHLGVALLALAPIAFLHDLRGSHLSEGQFGLTILFTIVASLIYEAVYLGAYALMGQIGGSVLDLFRVAVFGTMLNLVILFPIYGLLWTASADVRRPAFG